MRHGATKDRIALAKKVRQTGTWADVGAALGVSHVRAIKILRQAQHNASIPAWTAGLDIRTARILLEAGFKSKRKVQSTIERGDRIDRIGAGRLVILKQWLGLDTQAQTNSCISPDFL
jgi:hypothetical protein